MMPRHQTLLAIEARQRREAFLTKYTAEQAALERQTLAVKWEVKGGERNEQRDVLRNLDVVQAQHNDVLVERRRRLAELLSNENKEYERLMANLSETDEQRRERLLRKAQELRAQREEAKRMLCGARHDRLFREKIDCLRQAESRLKVLQVTDARFDQLDAAEAKRQSEKAEEEYFSQQTAESQRLATERMQNDLELQYQRAQRLKGDLAAQVAGNAYRKGIEKEETLRETEEFYRLLHEEQAAEARKKLERREKNKALAAEMMAMNDALQLARKEEYEALKKEDREALDAILLSIAEEKKAMQEEKRRRMEVEQRQMHDLQEQMAQKKEDTRMLDKLLAVENDKQWAKREAQWNADRQRREHLLRTILIIRRQQVLDKRQRAKDNAVQLKAEHEAFLESLAAERDVDAEERLRRLKMLKEIQQYQEMQIQQKEIDREAARVANRTALTDQQALEKQYEDRIAAEMANLEAARPKRFQHIPLLPPRSRNQPF